MPAIDQAVASLTRFDPSDSPQAAVLLLHGGAPQSDLPVGRWSASWRVMRWLQQGFEGAIRRRGLATSVWLLRYRFRGWNDGSSVVDSRWALESLRDELGEIPVSLVGHSMGGRTAIGAADHPSVTGVVALAPWIAPETSAAPSRAGGWSRRTAGPTRSPPSPRPRPSSSERGRWPGRLASWTWATSVTT